MKLIKSFSTVFVLIIPMLFTGCQNKEINKGGDTMNSQVFEAIIQGNEKYGNKRENTCNAVLKCDPSQISEKVILAPTWEPEIFKDHVDSINKISDPTGHTVYELIQDGKSFTYIMSGIGACNIMDIILALGTTNCKEVVFVGANGAIAENIKVGDVMIPEYSVCGVGADRYLCTGDLKNNDCFGKKYYPNDELFNKALDIAEATTANTEISVYKAQNFSIDTVYAEYLHLDEIIKMGCNSIEMETATVFHTADIAGIKAVAIFDVSDNTIDAKSLYSGRTKQDTQLRTKVKQQIIPEITLNLLNR